MSLQTKTLASEPPATPTEDFEPVTPQCGRRHVAKALLGKTTEPTPDGDPGGSSSSLWLTCLPGNAAHEIPRKWQSATSPRLLLVGPAELPPHIESSNWGPISRRNKGLSARGQVSSRRTGMIMAANKTGPTVEVQGVARPGPRPTPGKQIKKGRRHPDPRLRIYEKAHRTSIPEVEGIETACLEYSERHRDRTGYGREWFRGREWKAHVLHFCLARGWNTIPDGFEVHHQCRNRACVELEHLQLMARDEHRALLSQNCRACGAPYPFDCPTDARGYRKCPTCKDRRNGRKRVARQNHRAVAEADDQFSLPAPNYMRRFLNPRDLAAYFHDAIRATWPETFIPTKDVERDVAILRKQWCTDLTVGEVHDTLRTVVERWEELTFDLYEQGLLHPGWGGEIRVQKRPSIPFLTRHMAVVVNWHREIIRGQNEEAQQRLRDIANEDVEALLATVNRGNVVDVSERVWRICAARYGLREDYREPIIFDLRFARHFLKPQRMQVEQFADWTDESNASAEQQLPHRIVPAVLGEAAGRWAAFSRYVEKKNKAAIAARSPERDGTFGQPRWSVPKHPDINFVLQHFSDAIDWAWEEDLVEETHILAVREGIEDADGVRLLFLG